MRSRYIIKTVDTHNVKNQINFYAYVNKIDNIHVVLNVYSSVFYD